MNEREEALKRSRFEVDETARKVADLERTIRDFEALFDLDRQIKNEEARTKIEDPAHFAYSSFARSARARRDKLYASTEGLNAQLEATHEERDAAVERLSRIKSLAAQENLPRGALKINRQPSPGRGPSVRAFHKRFQFGRD